jgi:integrase
VGLEEATDRMKLILLLMGNCGITQQDVSDLKTSEVNWTAGRITRKRSKRSKDPKAKKVSWILWPTTAALLKEFHRPGSELVMTDGGEVLVQTNYDRVAGWYDRNLRPKIQARIPAFDKTLKQIRKMGASLLETNDQHHRFKDHWLAHAGKGMAEKHYTATYQKGLDEAVLWLGEQLGQVAPRKSKKKTSAK